MEKGLKKKPFWKFRFCENVGVVVGQVCVRSSCLNNNACLCVRLTIMFALVVLKQYRERLLFVPGISVKIDNIKRLGFQQSVDW